MLSESMIWWSLLTLPAWGMGLVHLVARMMSGSARRLTPLFGAILVGFTMGWIEPALYAPLHEWLPTLLTAIVRAASWLALTVWLAMYLAKAIGGWLRHGAACRTVTARATPGQSLP